MTSASASVGPTGSATPASCPTSGAHDLATSLYTSSTASTRASRPSRSFARPDRPPPWGEPPPAHPAGRRTPPSKPGSRRAVVKRALWLTRGAVLPSSLTRSSRRPARSGSGRLAVDAQRGDGETGQSLDRRLGLVGTTVEPDCRRRIGLEVPDPLGVSPHGRHDHGVADARCSQRHFVCPPRATASCCDRDRPDADHGRRPNTPLGERSHDEAVDGTKRGVGEQVKCGVHARINAVVVGSIPCRSEPVDAAAPGGRSHGQQPAQDVSG